MKKLSGPAVFMYSVIALTGIMSAACFHFYYSGTYTNGAVLWVGIIAFMILYHFGGRIFMGEVTKRFAFDYKHSFFARRSFEKKIFRILRVRSWKDKVLTFDPELPNRLPLPCASPRSTTG